MQDCNLIVVGSFVVLDRPSIVHSTVSRSICVCFFSFLDYATHTSHTIAHSIVTGRVSVSSTCMFACRFTAWPDDALQSTAENFLADVDMSDELRKSAGAMCMQFHSGVRNLTTRYAVEAKRHFYVTPTSYLQLLNAYKALYAKKNYDVSCAKRRYENGLEKLLFTEEQVMHY